MRRGWLYLALGGVCALAGCSDQGQDQPTAPEFKPVSSATACDFKQVSDLTGTYFSPPEKQTAQGFVTSMASAGSRSPGAIENGFAVMNLIGQVSRSTTPSSASVGSDLTKALTKCMFDVTKSEYTGLSTQGINGVQFDKALDYANGGVYYVVGAGYDIGSGVPNALKGTIASTGSRLSAAGPGPETFNADSSAFTLGNWTDLLAGSPNAYEGNRALVYAYPISQTPIEYEWATIDPLTSFTPYALLSVCDQGEDSTQMVHESSVGVIAFSSANLCGIPDATGTATGFRSHFKNTGVGSVSLAWVQKPPARMKLNQEYTAVIRVLTDVDGTSTGVNGACVRITGSNNNGVPTELTGTEECDDPSAIQLAAVSKSNDSNQAGFATFKITVTKAGGIVFTAAGFEVPGRTTTFANTLDTKSNVVP